MRKNEFQALENVKYIERIPINKLNQDGSIDQQYMNEQLNLLNSYIGKPRKGFILGVEKNFHHVNKGEHIFVVQQIVYHIGFEKKPMTI